MKSLTAKEQAALDFLSKRLWQRLGLLSRRSDPLRIRSALDDLHDTPHLAKLPTLLCLWHFGPQHSKRVVAEAIKASLDTLSLRQWRRLDEHLRGSFLAAHNQSQHVGIVKKPLEPTCDFGRILGLIHHSGFVREATLASIERISDPNVLALLILRCGDWVSPVRDAARQVWRKMKEDLSCQQLVYAVEGFQMLHQQARGDAKNYALGQNQSLTKKQDLRTLFLKHIEDTCCTRRRKIAASFLFEARQHLSTKTIAKLIQFAPPYFALRALDEVKQGSLETLLPIIGRPLDKRVCREVLRLWCEIDMAHVVPELISGLTDRHPMHRMFCRHFLQKAGPFDIPKHLKNLVTSAPNLRLKVDAIVALHDVCPPEAHEHAYRLIWSEGISLTTRQKRSLISVLNPAETPPTDQQIQGLFLNQSRIVCLGIATLLRKEHRMSDEDLLSILRMISAPDHSRKAALSLLTSRNKWVAARAILAALEGNDQELAALGHTAFVRWICDFQKSCTKPNAAQARDFQRLVENHSSKLQRQYRNLLSFALRDFAD